MEKHTMYTVSCSDRLFGGIVSVGSVLTLDEAVKIAQRDKQAKGRDTSRYCIHKNPRGFGYVDTPVVFSLIGEMGPRKAVA